MSQLTSVSHYDAGSKNGLDDKDKKESGSDREKSDVDSEDHIDYEVGSKGGSDGSDKWLVDLDEVHDEQFLHPTVDDDISKNIEIANVGYDGLPTLSMWNKVY